MDTRTPLPNSFTYTHVTESTFNDQLNLIAERFGVSENALANMFTNDQWLSSLDTELEEISEEKVRIAYTMLRLFTATEEPEDVDIINYMTQKKEELEPSVIAIMNHLDQKKAGMLASATDEFINTKARIIHKHGCHAGNEAAQLTYMKKTLALTILNAAKQIFQNWHSWDESKDEKFNAVFKNFAEINQKRELVLNHGAINLFNNSDLSSIQDSISDIFKAIHKQDCGHYTSMFRTPIDDLPDKFMQTIGLEARAFTLKNRAIYFHEGLFEIEAKAVANQKEFVSMLENLGSLKTDSLDSLENDKFADESYEAFRQACYQANDDIDVFRDVIAAKDALLNEINTQQDGIARLYQNLAEVKARQATSSEEDSRLLLQDIKLADDTREQIIMGLEQTNLTIHQAFQNSEHLKALENQREVIEATVTACKKELRELVRFAHEHASPLSMPKEKFNQATQSIDALKKATQALNKIYFALEEDYLASLQRFITVRNQIVTMLKNSQSRWLEDDLHQRLDATTLSINDLEKSYGQLEECKGTALDQAMPRYFYVMHQHNNATKATLDPDFVPESLRPEPPKQSFWQRHPVAKAVGIGALAGLGAAALAVGVAAIIFATGGAAAAVIGGFALGLVAKFTLGGTIGLGIGAGLAASAATGGIAGLIESVRQCFVGKKPAPAPKPAPVAPVRQSSARVLALLNEDDDTSDSYTPDIPDEELVTDAMVANDNTNAADTSPARKDSCTASESSLFTFVPIDDGNNNNNARQDSPKTALRKIINH